MPWVVEHCDGEVRIQDANYQTKFHGSSRSAAIQLAYMIDAKEVAEAECRRQHEEIEMLRRHNADLMNELQALKTRTP